MGHRGRRAFVPAGLVLILLLRACIPEPVSESLLRTCWPTGHSNRAAGAAAHMDHSTSVILLVWHCRQIQGAQVREPEATKCLPSVEHVTYMLSPNTSTSASASSSDDCSLPYASKQASWHDPAVQLPETWYIA